jgi:light-regulated signal transduction histidine kinase (bacteriophytochrome)
MDQLIDDLLLFSRLGRHELNRQRVEPHGIVIKVLESLQPMMENRNVSLEVAEDLPSCEADPSLLRQVFYNLLDNSIKYTRNREKAEIEIGWTQDDGSTVYFVRDNGVGFDMEYAAKLFDVFQRLHLSEDFEGTGVGLAIVKRIIQRHDGKIWVEAAEDKGATFFFSLNMS